LDSETVSIPVALLPGRSSFRQRLVAPLQKGGFELLSLERNDEAQLFLVDSEAEGATAALGQTNRGKNKAWPVLAIVNWSHPQSPPFVDGNFRARVDDWVGEDQLETELLPRMHRAMASRKARESLRQSNELLERLVDSSLEAVVAADMSGRVILFNQGAEAMSGYMAEEVVGKLDVRKLYLPDVARQIMARMRSPEAGGVGRLEASRVYLVAKSGEEIPVRLTGSILYEDGREIASVGFFSDLRDRMHLEQKLSDAESLLEQTRQTEAIVALAGTTAHELNQPLTSVMGYAELLKRKLKETNNDFAYRSVGIIYREAERMAEIVKKIGKITRYETKAYVGASKIIDLDKASSHEE
jgi:PAS domain S-box-containing protein